MCMRALVRVRVFVLCVSVRVSVYLPLSACMPLPAYLPFCPSVDLSTCLSICVCVYTDVCVFVCTHSHMQAYVYTIVSLQWVSICMPMVKNAPLGNIKEADCDGSTSV